MSGIFTLQAKDSETRARAGILRTPRGDVPTPVFMPVATQGSVKALSQEDLELLGTRAILANAYHLYLRPGTALIKAAGGLHKFMTYDGMILTDSGGFQVLSQPDLRSIDDDGVSFKSHIDGSNHRLTPGKVIEIQRELGSDCWTTLDVCSPYPCTEAAAAEALRRTMAWTDRSLPALAKARAEGCNPLFFPILQGSFFPELRKRAAEHLIASGADGVAIGGLSVGEPKDLTWTTLEAAACVLPEDRPRYLMGVGTPEELWKAAAGGVDMTDCVFPTRVARNGQVMTAVGRYNITNAASRESLGPLEGGCDCFVCRRYSRAYLRHIFRAAELASYRLLSFHNLHLMARISAQIREAILAGRFSAAWREFQARQQPRSLQK